MVSHVPSPSFNFFWEIGSSPGCEVTSGGGNTEWIPWMIALENFVRFSLDKLLVIAQKSSTNTSRRLVVNAAASRRWRRSPCSSILGRNLWWGRSMSLLSRLSMTSRAVSVAAQKYGGDSHQPICKELGTTMSISSNGWSGSRDGST